MARAESDSDMVRLHIHFAKHLVLNFQISSTKFQINSKIQYPKFANAEACSSFKILGIVICLFFVICYLEF